MSLTAQGTVEVAGEEHAPVFSTLSGCYAGEDTLVRDVASIANEVLWIALCRVQVIIDWAKSVTKIQ